MENKVKMLLEAKKALGCYVALRLWCRLAVQAPSPDQ